jgi:hypothetical protein
MIINNYFGFNIKIYLKKVFESFPLLTSIYQEFYECIIYMANEGHHIRVSE